MAESKSIEIVINNRLGLHARPAAAFVRTASEFNSEITVDKDGESINGKSLIGILMLAAGYNTKITITAAGNDCTEAIDALENLIQNDKEFNEE